MNLNNYQKRGTMTPTLYSLPSKEKKIKEYNIYFPKEMLDDNKQYPVIVAVNGIIEPAKMYFHVFEHLASWGFIVIGTQDENSWTGYTANASLKLLLNLNESDNNPFYNKIDINNIGLLGHSEGGVGSINAMKHPQLGKFYKTLYTASMPSLALSRTILWNYDVSQIQVPYCMVQSTGWADSLFFTPHVFIKNNYKKTPNNISKIKARYVGGTHNGMLWHVMSGYTAWFMWQLQNDKHAAKIFVGQNAGILNDKDWVDIEKNF